jgi:hypothetical protein
MKPIFFKNAIALGLAASLTWSCAKTRNAELPAEQQNGTLVISELQGATFKVDVSGAAASTVQQKLVTDLSLSEKSVIAINSVPERYRFLFKNVEVYNYGQASLNIMIGLDKSNLTAYQEIESSQAKSKKAEMSIALTKEEITARFQVGRSESPSSEVQKIEGLKLAREKSMLTSSSDKMYVPLFKVALKSYGLLEKKRNDLNEETSVLQLKATDWDMASHIQISDFSKDRLDVVISEEISSGRSSLIEADQLNGRTLNFANLGTALHLSQESGLSLNSDSIFYTRIGKENLRIFEYTVLTEQLKALIGQDESALVAACPAAIEKELKDKTLSCALLARADIKLTGQKIELDSEKGIDKNTVSMKEIKDLSKATLVKLGDIKALSTETVESMSEDFKSIVSKAQN